MKKFSWNWGITWQISPCRQEEGKQRVHVRCRCGVKAKADSMRALQSVGRRKGREGGRLDIWKKEASAEPRIEKEKTAAEGEVERREGMIFVGVVAGCCCFAAMVSFSFFWRRKRGGFGRCLRVFLLIKRLYSVLGSWAERKRDPRTQPRRTG